MIKGYCRTNLDGYGRCDWPEVFVALPRVGDCVEANDRSLRICAITHKVATENIYCKTISIQKGEPYIEVELTKRV